MKKLLRFTITKRTQWLAAGLLLAMHLSISSYSQPRGRGFAAPDEAVKSLQVALAARNTNELFQIFGPELNEIMNPDPVEATNELVMVATALSETNTLIATEKNWRLLQYGHDNTLFPIPLVEHRGRWYFDTPVGIEEVINRRIGRNELAVLEIIRTYVQAQREYASLDRDFDEVLEYAQRFGSTEGKKDGLFWRPDLDGTLSPLGPLVAEAESAGYSKQTNVVRQSFHGYYFKILTRQGKHAPGGAHDYLINGNMIAGFGLVAWPAEYGETGVMTFIVNQQGRVFQKDLGKGSSETAEAMNSYDPDSTWAASPD